MVEIRYGLEHAITTLPDALTRFSATTMNVMCA